MIALHIHDIIRYSQKKMTEKYILYIYFILEQTCGTVPNESRIEVSGEIKRAVCAPIVVGVM